MARICRLLILPICSCLLSLLQTDYCKVLLLMKSHDEKFSFSHDNFKGQSFHKTFDRQFLKLVLISQRLLRTWRFHYITLNQIANFKTNSRISHHTLWEFGEVP